MSKDADFPDVSLIVPSGVYWRFTDEREVTEYGVVEDAQKPLLPDEPHTNVFVPVEPAPPVALRIIQVDAFYLL